MPRRAISSSRRATCSTSLGASPSVGSSMMTRSGSPISVRHMVSILLLAARQDAGLIGLALAEVGEQPEHVVEGPAAELAGALQPQFEVLPHRQAGEDLAVLRHVAQPGMAISSARRPAIAGP